MTAIPRDDILNMKRPRILMTAAKLGCEDYRRERDLRRVLRTSRPPSPSSALAQLTEAEKTLNAARIAADANYNVARHVRVMTALLAEIKGLAVRA